MKYFLIFDFARISCDRAKIAEILEKQKFKYINHNDVLWEVEIDPLFPCEFIGTTASLIHGLFLKYTQTDTAILAVKAEEYFPTEL